MKKISIIFIIISLGLFSCKPYNAVKNVVVVNKDSLEIVTKDNKTYNGKGALPTLSSKYITLITPDDKKIEIASKNIEYLLAWHEKQGKDEAHKFIYTPVKEYESFDANSKAKTLKDRPRWLLLLSRVDSMAMYVEHQEYDLKKQGGIQGNSTGVVSIPAYVWYYIRKDNKSFPTRVGLDSSAGAAADKYFKNMGQKYFSDCPSVAEKIKEGKIDTNHIEEAMKEYSKTMK